VVEITAFMIGVSVGLYVSALLNGFITVITSHETRLCFDWKMIHPNVWDISSACQDWYQAGSVHPRTGDFFVFLLDSKGWIF
jgi:hypothetical protein